MDQQATSDAAKTTSKMATVEVSLPPAPSQSIGHAKRVVTIAGSTTDGSQDVAIDAKAPIILKAALDAKVSIWVAEVLANGRQSPPCTVSFTPYDQVEATAADAAAFAIKVTAISDQSA